MPPDADGVRDILIVRHGETVWNRERRVMGSLDIQLSEAGRYQCEELAAVLARFEVGRILSSPLARASESAEILARELGVEIEYDPGLEEVHFGRWEGMTYDEIRADPDYHGFIADPVGHPTPGGETIVDVQRRGLAALARARQDTRVLVVSHGDIIRAALCHYMAIPLPEFRRIRVDNCGLSALTDTAGRIEVKFVNMLPDPARAWDPLHWTRAT